MKKLFLLLLPTLLFLASCSNDEGEEGFADPEQSSALVNSTASQAQGDITELVDSEGVQSLIHMFDLLDEHNVLNGRTDQQQWAKEKFKIIAQYFVNGPSARVGEDGPTSFEDIKGEYEWNFETQEFDMVESEFFIVRFPTEGSTTNDAEFKISDLQFVTITEDQGDFIDEYEVPSVIVAYLKVDGVTLASLDLEIDWSSTGFPEKAEVALFLDPFDFMIGLDATFEVKSSLILSVKKDSEVIVGIDLDVEFETSAKEEPVLFEGYVQYRDLKISGNVDANGIGDDADPNDFIHLALYSGEDKVGDIVFVLEEVEPGFDDYVAYVQYGDGSKENLEEILEPVIAEIESALENFE